MPLAVRLSQLGLRDGLLPLQPLQLRRKALSLRLGCTQARVPVLVPPPLLLCLAPQSPK